jgi:hypothetical protein
MPPPIRKPFALRIDPALHTAIERIAASELRSVNAQIECLLREALTRRGVRLTPADPPRRGRPLKEPTDEA